MPDLHTCNICGEDKPEEDFYEHPGQTCAECKKEYNRARSAGKMDVFRRKYDLDAKSKDDVPKRDDETYWQYARRLRDRCIIKTYEMIDIYAQDPDVSQQEARERVMEWWLPPGPRNHGAGMARRTGQAGYKDQKDGHVETGDGTTKGPHPEEYTG